MNLRVAPTPAEIQAIKNLSSEARADLAAQICATDPYTIFDAVEGKEGKQIICPKCGNGSGSSKTGIIPKFEGGKWLYHCFKCNDFKGDLISVIADANNLSTRGEDFFEVLAIGARILGLNVSDAPHTPKFKTAAPTKEDTAKLEQIRADLALPNNLSAFPKKKYRGLYMSSLKKFGVIYVEKWLPIWARLQNIHVTPTPRMLFPAGEHYLARLTVPLDKFKGAADFECIKDKPHAGTKHPFGIWTISAETKYIIIVEGELDVVSIYQALEQICPEKLKEIAIIATCSAIKGGAVADEVVDALKKFDLIGKVKVLINYDADDAGKDFAPKLREFFLLKDCPAVCDFLPTHSDGSKRDANNILVEGDDDSITGTTGEIELANLILAMLARNESKWCESLAEINTLRYEKAKKESAEKAKRSDEQILKTLLYSPQNDMDNATRLAVKFGDIIRYNTETERWGLFNDGVWKFETSSNSALYPYARQIADIIKENLPKLPEQKFTKNADGSISGDPNFKPPTDEEKKNFAIIDSLQRSWRKQKTQRNAIEMLKGVPEILINSKELDAHPNLINCKNGVVVDLKTGKYFPASADFYLTQQAGANYNPNWTQEDNHVVEIFLREILPAKDFRECLLKWLGYNLTGEVNEERFVFIKGRGGNGKGTLSKVLLKMLGDYACSFPIGGILRRKSYDANAATTAINILKNKRAVIAEEIPPNANVDPAQLKILTGGDAIPIRLNYGEYQNMEPTFKLTFSGNNNLQFPDANDYGIKRRLINIPFEQDFTQNPDPHLKAKLLEQSALDYFFNKLIRVAKQWYDEGLTIPAVVQSAADEYLKSQDFIAEFIAENCEYDANSYITRKDFTDKLFVAYPRETPGNAQTLREMLEKIEGVEYKRDKKSMVLKGIKWRTQN